jgi:hypothetical protein
MMRLACELVAVVAAVLLIGHFLNPMLGRPVFDPTVLLAVIIGTAISNCFGYVRRRRRRNRRVARSSD